jgi:hypothetical protein
LEPGKDQLAVAGRLARIAVIVSLAIGLVAPAGARGAAVEPTSWGGANLISYADSDFESGVGNWVARANTTVSEATTAAFAHRASLQLTAARPGSQSAQLGNGPAAPRIYVRAGEAYRESAWFKAAAASGRTVTFADNFFDRSGRWLGSVAGAPVTLSGSAKWQYASALITAPTGAAYMSASPRIVERGVKAGETLDVDEVLVEPYRAATLIGAKDPSTDGSEFGYANSMIGPLQADKLFYGNSRALPARYSASTCNNLPWDVTCVLAYKVPTTNVASFVSSIPAGRNTILIWHQEPEHDPFPGHCGSSGANFVCEFEAQARLIRSHTTPVNRANVWIADNATTYQYDPGTNFNSGGAEGSCAYTVPSRYVDFYLADIYESSGNRTRGGTLEDSPTWKGWLSCVLPQNKPIGLAEYGVNCETSANEASTHEAMAADDRYLRNQSFVPAGSSRAFSRPVVLWEYWWYDNGGERCQFTPSGGPGGALAVQQWRANETGDGSQGLFAVLASGAAFG